MTEPTGGPFFPIPPCGTGDPRDGMTTGREGATLLDYFAGQALAGMMANADVAKRGISINGEEQQINDACYAIAAGMLRARQKLLNEKETQ